MAGITPPTTAAITPSKLMGAQVKRKEDPRMITGASTYVTDIGLLLRMPAGAHRLSATAARWPEIRTPAKATPARATPGAHAPHAPGPGPR